MAVSFCQAPATLVARALRLMMPAVQPAKANAVLSAESGLKSTQAALGAMKRVRCAAVMIQINYGRGL
jgi:hypothetical protein